MHHLASRRLLFVAVIGFVVILNACGSSDGNDSASNADDTRTVNVQMRDIAFSPNSIDVQAGETVRFVFKNTGKVVHDAFIGDEAAQDDHEMEMRSASSTTMGDMDHGGMDGEEGVAVEPGKTGELTHTFRAGDRLLIGCHEVGHYASGMKITINVA